MRNMLYMATENMLTVKLFKKQRTTFYTKYRRATKANMSISN